MTLRTMIGEDALITGPLIEPLDLDELKKVLRFTATSEDTLLDMWVSAARQYFEDQTSRQVIRALRQFSLEAFPVGGVIELPHPPLLEVVGVSYGDSAGVWQDVDALSYTVVSHANGSPATVTEPFSARGMITLNTDASWPTPIGRARAVRVQFYAGYGDTPGDVPEIVRACLYDLVRHFHSRPDGDLPMTTQVMLRMFRQSAISQVAMERTV